MAAPGPVFGRGRLCFLASPDPPAAHSVATPGAASLPGGGARASSALDRPSLPACSVDVREQTTCERRDHGASKWTRAAGRAQTRARRHRRVPARTGEAPRSEAALLGMGTALLFGACVSSASAVIVHLAGGRALSYQPLRGAAPSLRVQPFAGKNLVYHGGPVMISNTNYTFYWAPAGSTPTRPATERRGPVHGRPRA